MASTESKKASDTGIGDASPAGEANTDRPNETGNDAVSDPVLRELGKLNLDLEELLRVYR
jgi:hypothetical protein